MSAPADRDASRLYYSYRIIEGGGGGVLVVVTQCLLLPTGTHHSYTTHTVSLGGGGGGGGGGELLVVVTQCLLLPTGTHHSYTTHTVSLRGGGGGDPSRSYAVSAPADRDASQLYYSYRIIKGGGGGGEILVVGTQCLLLPTGTHHSYTTHTVSLRGGGGARVATPNDCEAPINC